MRLILLAAALLFSVDICFSAVPAPTAMPVGVTAKLPVKKPAHEKRKKTVAFISGLVLGPVGLGGVFLFTHDHAQRKAAEKGCAIFGIVVVTAAFCWLLVLGLKDVNFGGSGSSSHSGGSTSSRGSGSSGSSGRSGTTGRSGSAGASHGSNTDWLNNLNFPSITPANPRPQKKPTPAQLPADLPGWTF